MVMLIEDQGLLRPSRSIQEFRIDFLLEEEFAVDLQFARSFAAASGWTCTPSSVERVVHSLSDKHGEADLVVLLGAIGPAGAKETHALLIEDKITAGLQPAQAARYRRRGEEGLRSEHWNSFTTVLVAPRAYIPEMHEFDAAVALEQIKDWICTDDLARRKFKLLKIDEAIAKKNTTGVQVVDVDMTTFRAAYYAELQNFNSKHGTDFTMRAPAPTYYGDYWFRLKSTSLPNYAEFRHMAPTGTIELNFKDTDFEAASGLQKLIEDDVFFITTGKHHQHVTLRLSTPKISVFDNFARDREKVEAAFLNAKRLLQLLIQRRPEFDAVLKLARRK